MPKDCIRKAVVVGGGGGTHKQVQFSQEVELNKKKYYQFKYGVNFYLCNTMRVAVSDLKTKKIVALYGVEKPGEFENEEATSQLRRILREKGISLIRERPPPVLELERVQKKFEELSNAKVQFRFGTVLDIKDVNDKNVTDFTTYNRIIDAHTLLICILVDNKCVS
jgi:hypothetical protein